MTELRAFDGSWARAEHRDGGASVGVGGPTDLWSIVEDAYDWWNAAGRPAWGRFGLSATQDAQTVWLDDSQHEISREPATASSGPAR